MACGDVTTISYDTTINLCHDDPDSNVGEKIRYAGMFYPRMGQSNIHCTVRTSVATTSTSSLQARTFGRPYVVYLYENR